MPNSELVPVNPKERASQYEDPQLIATIKATVCKGASDAQLRMFLEICKRTGLDPFLREIWFVAETGVIMAGRDGYLRVANEHPMFDGMETRVERTEQGIPIKAICSVWRKDRAHPITCEAFFNEYAKQSPVWRQYKSAMIGKVAEVLALKRSFSINGVVTEEEIGYAQDTPKDGKGWDVDGEQRAKQVAEEKLAALNSGKNYEDISARDERRELKMVESSFSTEEPSIPPDRIVPPPEPKPPFSMSKSIEEFSKLKKFAADNLGEKRGEEIYYTVLGRFGAEHSNQIKFAKPARECYRELANEIDAAISYKSREQGKPDAFDEHMAAQTKK